MSALQWKDGYLVLDEPTAEERAWRRASGAARVLADVEARLVAAGAVTELRQLRGLSAAEQDVLVRLERDAHDHEDPGHVPSVSTGSQGLPSGCPQTTWTTVAA